MIKVSVKGNFQGLVSHLETVKKQISGGEFVIRLAQLLNSSIQLRVQRSGIGSKGEMSPYSAAYATWKGNRGRNTKFRDLTYSGKMWQSLTTTPVSGGAKMFFGNAESANKAKGNEARSPFFSLTDREKRLVKNELQKLVKNVN